MDFRRSCRWPVGLDNSALSPSLLPALHGHLDMEFDALYPLDIVIWCLWQGSEASLFLTIRFYLDTGVVAILVSWTGSSSFDIYIPWTYSHLGLKLTT